FTVYSVSLDKSRAAWKAAIAQDNLHWPYHVSDLGAWSSAGARIYGVNSIPMNFLIDPDGIIVAKNLRGTQLDQALDPFVKSFKHYRSRFLLPADLAVRFLDRLSICPIFAPQ